MPSNLKINKNYSIKALGNITNVFMSKNAIITTNAKKVKVLQIDDEQFFDIDPDKKPSNQNNLYNLSTG